MTSKIGNSGWSSYARIKHAEFAGNERKVIMRKTVGVRPVVVSQIQIIVEDARVFGTMK